MAKFPDLPSVSSLVKNLDLSNADFNLTANKTELQGAIRTIGSQSTAVKEFLQQNPSAENFTKAATAATARRTELQNLIDNPNTPTDLKSQIQGKIDDLNVDIADFNARARPGGGGTPNAPEPKPGDAANQAANNAAEVAALRRELDDLKAQNASKNETPETMSQKAWQFAKDHPLITIGGLTAAGFAAYAIAKMAKSEETERRIINVEYAQAGTFGLRNKKLIKITFSPTERITMGDVITISGSKTTPSIDGAGLVATQILSDSAFIYTAPQDITGLQSGGTLQVKTSFEAQFMDATRETAKGGGSIIGGVTGGIAGGIGDGISSFFSGLDATAWIIIFGIIALVFLFKR